METPPADIKTATKAVKAMADPTGQPAGDMPLLKAPRFSILGLVSGLSNIVPLVVWIGGGLVSRVANWNWTQKVPLLGKSLKTIGPVAALSEVPVGQFAGEAAKIKVLQKASPFIQGTSSRVAKYAQSVVGQSKLGGVMLQRVAETSMGNAVFSGGMIVGEGANVAITTKTRLRVLRQMETDLTGKTPSTWAVLMGNSLSPQVLQARKELTGKKAVSSTLLQMGGMVGTALLMVFDRGKGRFGPIVKQVGLSMGTSMVGGMLTASDTALASYAALHQSFAQTGQAGLQEYMGVIGGFTKQADNQMVEKFAQQCCDEQVKPAELLRRIKTFQQALASKLDSAGKPLPATIGINTAKLNASRAGQGVAAQKAFSPV